MLQSGGRFKALIFKSFRSGACQLVTSPRLNRQSLLKLIVFPGLAFAKAWELQNMTSVTIRRQLVVSLFISMDSSCGLIAGLVPGGKWPSVDSSLHWSKMSNCIVGRGLQ